MDWKVWINKQVFVRTRKERVYAGVIKDVDDASPPLIWISMIDKYGMLVQFTSDEIAEIKEEVAQ